MLPRLPARRAAALVTLAGVLSAAACSPDPEKVDVGDGSGPDKTGAASPFPSAVPRVITTGSLTFTLPVAGDARAEAIYVGYQTFWVSLARALAKGDPNEPTWYATTTGGARKLFANNLTNMRLVRQTQSGPAKLQPVIASASASSAQLSDCADLSQLRLRHSSGQPVNPPDPKTTQIEVTMAFQSGKWVVQNYDETVRGCKPRT